MLAVQRRTYGSPDGLTVVEAPVPEPGEGEVLVEVRAAGLDQGVLHLVEGTPYALRLVFGLRRPKQPGIGLDLAGVVAGVGPGVSGFAVGDEVCGIGAATFAERAVAPVAKLIRKPADLSFAEAAALPVSGLTALQAVRSWVGPDQRVLVLGASGGVGTYAVQLAKARGARVTAVCSAAKAAAVQALGADEVLDYAAGAPAGRWDVVLAIGGDLPVRRLRSLLTPAGTLVIIGGDMAGGVFGGPVLGIGRQLRAVALNPLVRQRLAMLVASESGEDLQELAEAVAAGQVRPVIGARYSLGEAAAAVRDLAAGRITGKAVLEVG
jgi:NADPH:quinone reductase-like Zn-dependent oxidoreductase